MVSRARTASRSRVTSPFLAGVFDAYRRGLWRFGNDLSSGISSIRNDVRSVAEGSEAPLTRPSLTVLGMLCLLAGVSARSFFAPWPATPRDPWLVIAQAVGWALVRAVMLALASRRLSGDRRALVGAWSFGLVPMILAVTPWSAPISWLLSALATRYALTRFSVTPKEATRIVTIAWSVQAALLALVAIVGWLALNLSVATLIGA